MGEIEEALEKFDEEWLEEQEEKAIRKKKGRRRYSGKYKGRGKYIARDF